MTKYPSPERVEAEARQALLNQRSDRAFELLKVDVRRSGLDDGFMDGRARMAVMAAMHIEYELEKANEQD